MTTGGAVEIGRLPDEPYGLMLIELDELAEDPERVITEGAGREMAVLGALDDGITMGVALGVFESSCLEDPGLRYEEEDTVELL